MKTSSTEDEATIFVVDDNHRRQLNKCNFPNRLKRGQRVSDPEDADDENEISREIIVHNTDNEVVKRERPTSLTGIHNHYDHTATYHDMSGPCYQYPCFPR